jgi:GAF domain-containing protein
MRAVAQGWFKNARSSLVPTVVEQTNRGERAYDIYSRRVKAVVHHDDLKKEWVQAGKPEAARTLIELGGARTFLGVPMLRGGELVGALGICRQEVRPFTDKQIELVENFAKQAVIAIENARLLNDLRESLEQQTATSDVLQIISSSPGELQPVFDKMLENATRVCNAEFGTMLLEGDGAFRHVALYNVPPAFAEFVGRDTVVHSPRDGVLGRVAQTKQPIHITDLRDEPVYLRGAESARMLADLGGARSVLGVPMLRQGELVGALGIYRQEVRPFTDKQIELVQNFVAQAVIAIENARLLDELRQRTADLTESLEQQTATSDVLQVISSSPGELELVFEKMLGSAARVCNAKFGSLLLQEEGVFRYVAQHNVPSALAELMRCEPRVRAPPDSPLDRMARMKQVVHVADVRAEEAYIRGAAMVRMADVGGARTILYVRMLKGDELIGVIGIYRQEVQPFSDKQIELVSNFASQAVIAIENMRLLKELRESLEQQTATSQVLGVISSSPGELEPVFNTILENATRICDAGFGTLLSYDGEAFRNIALCNVPPAFAEQDKGNPFVPPSDAPLGRFRETKQPIHVADLRTEPAYKRGFAPIQRPLLPDSEIVGTFVIRSISRMPRRRSFGGHRSFGSSSNEA